MTETAFGEISAPEDGFDPADPANNSPIVVALCADEAQNITGQVFLVYGGTVNMLRGWHAGELFQTDERWNPDSLLAEIQGRLPEGAAPAGMLASMQEAGGRSMRTL
jgi:3-oxoacyl-[acyl-carrier protein] reductase